MVPLRFIYSFLLKISWYVLTVIALFNAKIKRFVSGRKNVFETINSIIDTDTPTIWMHVASLGEYEQGLPILEKLKASYPDYTIVLTFFSPSGYEIKKNTPAADVVIYLPMDTRSNARRFLNSIQPKLAIFIKYEIWPNYLYELQKLEIPTLLVSAIFSKKQIFFSPFGGFMRKSLRAFSRFFVQNRDSKELLKSIGFENVTASGDTRFDRVYEILKRDNQLDFMGDFKGNKRCMVAGSTWPEDEAILLKHINQSPKNIRWVIAPHEIKANHVNTIVDKLQKKVVRYSERDSEDLSKAEVLVVDTIGLLTKIYSYADLAYVGGGFATGLHNTLEPAAFGIPVIIGPKYQGFKEAEDLVEKGGIISIKNQQEFDEVMEKILEDETLLRKKGAINSEYLEQQTGATHIILNYIEKIL